MVTQTRSAGLATLLALLLCLSHRGEAAEFMVQASVANQTYQIRSADGSRLGLARLDTYLRLFALNLLPEKDDASATRPQTQMHIVLSLRLRADFGGFTRNWDTAADGHGVEQWVSPSEHPNLEILYAHLAVTDLAGFMDLKIGRLFQLDAMDFYGFDGLWFRARLPFNVALEVVGGLRNSGHWAIDAPIFLLDGTSLTDTRPGAYMPMVGVAAETHGLSWLRVRVAYRTTWSLLSTKDAGDLYQDPEGTQIPGTVTAEEKLTAFALGTFWKRHLSVYGGVRYNLLQDRLDDAQAGVAGRFGRGSQVRAEYVREQPDFDGDSIFNIFNANAYQEVRLWYEHRFTARWQAYLRTTVRLFAGGDPDSTVASEQATLEPDVGGGLGAHYLGQRVAARLDLYWQEGYGGRTLGAFGFVRGTVIPGWLALEGRAVIAHWSDDLSVTPEGITAGLTLGARVRFARRVALHVMVEDNFGTYNRSDLRLFALVNVSWCTAGYCPAGEVIP